jgi:hypothetical protein
MKQVYLVMLTSDDEYYPAKVLTVHADEKTAQVQVLAYTFNCARRSDLPIGHEYFWDNFPRMYVEAHELFE